MLWVDKEELDATDAAMRSPQVGDHFTEMYTFHVFVIDIRDSGNTIITIEASPPCEFPRDGKIKIQTINEFRKRFAYGRIHGYWVRLVERDCNVEGWLK